ncbi:putative acetyltransferase [Palleronia marisminoris]|uniref:Putative N-acetyltransferase YsnE n=1 Tax=Palleronia marisminoris TaxID=315423 RepID=A0A1Y5SHA8_9RHOB|nr:GNAT family N-acetyltransferase [Palleronia marisminoris]SFG82303.1 putative acetyltransferase [Palleronia marisminoris]SLN40489.1 putative N-acetyltransferase YsnE [Palleronia marisminoris]
MQITVHPCDPMDRAVRRRLAESAALMACLFPPDDHHGIDGSEPDLSMWAAHSGGAVVGTAALAMREGYGEVKGMFVAPEVRGHGIGMRLLEAVEGAARDEGLLILRLDTGATLDAACRLYAGAGFVPCEAFGDYASGTTSIFMEKLL